MLISPPLHCTDTYLTGTWAGLCANMNLIVLSKAVYEYHQEPMNILKKHRKERDTPTYLIKIAKARHQYSFTIFRRSLRGHAPSTCGYAHHVRPHP